MKAEHYPTLGKCMELMREGMRIMIASENRATGVRSTVLLSYEVEGSPKCPASPEFDALRDLRACRLFEADLKRLQCHNTTPSFFNTFTFTNTHTITHPRTQDGPTVAARSSGS